MPQNVKKSLEKTGQTLVFEGDEVLIEGKWRLTRRRYERFLQVLQRRQPDLTVVLENIHDPFNASAVLRTADAMGVCDIHLVYTWEKFPEISHGVASSAEKWLFLHRHSSIPQAFDHLRAQGFHIYATGLVPKAKAPYECDLTQPVAIVLGNEHEGVSEEALRLADDVIRIPMLGMVQSLNVTVAAGMILYEAMRQRMQKGFFEQPRLDEQRLAKILRFWLQRQIGRSP